MRLLLDTHTLLWLVADDPSLSQTAKSLLIDPTCELLLSPASFWELAIKISLGKYRLVEPLAQFVEEAIRLYDLKVLPITVQHTQAIVSLPHHHKDPFDRMLIAQGIVENIAIVSSDMDFDAYSVNRLW